jgi:hypothetical protein
LVCCPQVFSALQLLFCVAAASVAWWVRRFTVFQLAVAKGWGAFRILSLDILGGSDYAHTAAARRLLAIVALDHPFLGFIRLCFNNYVNTGLWVWRCGVIFGFSPGLLGRGGDICDSHFGERCFTVICLTLMTS